MRLEWAPAGLQIVPNTSKIEVESRIRRPNKKQKPIHYPSFWKAADYLLLAAIQYDDQWEGLTPTKNLEMWFIFSILN